MTYLFKKVVFLDTLTQYHFVKVSLNVIACDVSATIRRVTSTKSDVTEKTCHLQIKVSITSWLLANLQFKISFIVTYSAIFSLSRDWSVVIGGRNRSLGKKHRLISSNWQLPQMLRPGFEPCK